MSTKYLSVGQVAQRCGVKVSTLHFYEKKELIYSHRNAGNQRIYAKETIRRVSLIKAAQQLGISLHEIAQVFEELPEKRTPNAQDWSQLSKKWQEKLNQRIHRLVLLKETLEGCIGCGCLSMDKCPIYNPEDRLASYGSGAVVLNGKKDK